MHNVIAKSCHSADSAHSRELEENHASLDLPFVWSFACVEAVFMSKHEGAGRFSLNGFVGRMLSSSNIWRRRRRKFTTSIQPAKAYEDESVMLSGPH